MKRPALAVSLIALATATLVVSIADANIYYRGTDHVFGTVAAPLPEGPDEDGGNGDGGSTPPNGGGQNETSPVSLSFPAKTNLKLGGAVLSEPSLVTGPASGFRLSSSGGEIRVCSSYDCAGAGGFASSAAAVSGNYVQARVAGPASPGAVSSVSVVSGSFSTQFRATGSSADAGLTALQDVSGAEPGASVQSAPSGLYGYVSAQLSVSGGEQQACGQSGCGPWTAGTITLSEGESVRLRATAGRFGETRRVRATIAGGASTSFAVSTRSIDQSPDAFSFSPSSVADVEPFVAATSPVVRPTGFDQADVSVVNGEYQICSVADCSDQDGWQSGVAYDVLPGHYLRVRATPAFYGESSAATLRVGDAEATFVATARRQDTAPDDFAVAGATGVEPSTRVVSGVVVPTGFEGTVAVVASGGEVSVDGGQTWAASRQLTVGGSFRVRLVSSSAFDGSSTASVRVGTGKAATFTAVTRSQDTLPDAFVLAAAAGVEPNAEVRSDLATPTGFEGSVPVAVAGGEASTDGGSTWGANRTLVAGGSFRVRLVSAQFGGTATATVTVGTGSPVAFQATTRAKDETPDAFSFASAGGVEPGVPAVSAVIRPTGYDSADVAISGGEFQVCGTATCGDQSAWRTGALADLPAGYYMRVRVVPPEFGAGATATLSVGGASASFTATARPQSVAGAFSVPSVSGAEPGVLVSSADVVPTGIEGTVTASATNGEISVDGGSTWAASRRLAAGGSFRVRLLSAPFGGTATAAVTVGTGTGDFVVATRAKDVTPSPFAFAAVSGTEPGQRAVSDVVRPTTYDAADVTVSGGEYQICGTATCGDQPGWRTAASADVPSGSWYRVRTPVLSYGQSTAVTLSVGGASATFSASARPQDTQPDAFSFAVANAVEPNAPVLSEVVTPAGFEGTVPLSVDGGEASTDGGSTWGPTRTLALGGSFRVRLTSADFGGSATAQVTLGTGAPVAFTATTRSRDTTPDAFSVPASTGAEPGAVVVSDEVAPTGYEGSVALVSADGEVSVDAGATWGTSRTLSAGGSFRVRTTAGSFGATVTARVTVGTGSPVAFAVTTRAKDTAPDQFVFAPVTGVEPGVPAVSATARPTGYDAADVSVVGGDYQLCAQPDCSDQSAWRTAATQDLPAGYTMRLRTTPSTWGETRTATLTVGGTSASFAATARSQDTQPDAFSFQPVSNAEPNVATASAPVVPTGFEGSVPVSAAGGEVSVDGGAFAASGTLAAGKAIAARVVSGPYGETRTAQVTVGTAAPVPFSVSTKAAKAAPDSYAFAPASKQKASTTSDSAPVQLTGMAGPGPFSLTGGISPLVSVNGGAFAAAPSQVPENAVLRLRTTTASAADGSAVALVATVGGVSATWTVTNEDTVVNAFSIPSRSAAGQSERVVSTAVTPTGYDVPIAFSVAGAAGSPTLSTSSDGTTWSAEAASVTLSPGQRLRVHVTASASEIGTVAATVSGGGKTATFAVETGDATPGAYAVAATTVAGGTDAVSDPTTLTGMSIPGSLTLPAAVAISTDGGTSYGRPSTVPANASFRLKAATSGFAPSSTPYSISIGGVAATWTVATSDRQPDAFAVASLQGEDRGTLVASDDVTPVGYAAATTVAVSGEGSPQVQVAGGAWATSATISPGQAFKVRLTTSTTPLATLTATVTVGGVSGTFSVKSAGNDAAPDAYVIAAVTNANPSGTVTSAEIAPTGFDAATTIATTGGSGTQVSVNGRAYAATARLRPGETFRVRTTASSAFSTSTPVTVANGGVSSTWNVATRAFDNVPDTLSFASALSAPGNSTIVSATVTPTGFTDTTTLVLTNGEASVDDGTTWAANLTLTPGQTLKLRMTTPDPDGLSKTVLVKLSDGTQIGSWSTTTADTMMTVPWTQTELDTMFTATPMTNGKAATEYQKTPTGFTSPAYYSGYSCTATSGTTTNIVPLFIADGQNRGVGSYVNPGQTLSLYFAAAGQIDLGAAGTCTWNLGGRTFTTKYQYTSSQPNPNYARTIEFTPAASGTVISSAYYPDGNRSAALAQVSSGSQIEVGGNGTWIAGTGSTWNSSTSSWAATYAAPTNGVRVPVGSYFRVRTAAAAKQVTVFVGESYQFFNNWDVTTAASNTNVAGVIASNPYPTNVTGTTINGSVPYYLTGSTTNNQYLLPRGTLNACVDATLTQSTGFYFYVINNGSGHLNLASGESAYNHRICPGEKLNLFVQTPDVAGKTYSATLAIGNWSQQISYTLSGSGVDGDPDAFSFPAVTAATPGATIASSGITPTGYTTKTSVSVSGAGGVQYSVGGGAWTSAAGTISPGQSLQLRMTAGAATGETRTASVTVGSTTSSWSVSTSDTTPDAFSLAAVSGSDPSANVVSGTVTVAGLGTGVQATATVSGLSSSFSVNGGSQVASALVKNGDVLRLYASAPAAYASSGAATLTVGAGSATWTVGTRAKDDVPNQFSIPATAGETAGSTVTSSTVTPSGFLDAAAFTVTGGSVSVDSGAFVASGTIEPGSRFVVRAIASTTPGASTTARVTIGGVSADFVVTTAE